MAALISDSGAEAEKVGDKREIEADPKQDLHNMRAAQCDLRDAAHEK